MNKYIRAFRLKLIDLRAFPADFYLGFLAVPLQIGVVYFFWRNSLGTSEVAGVTAGGLGAYFLSLQVLRVSMLPGLVVTWDLWDDISRGNVTVWLIRPIHYAWYLFFQKLSEYQVKIVASMTVILLPALVLTRYTGITRLLLGYLSSLLGFAILFEVHFIIGTLTVFVGNVLSLRDNVINFTTLLGGGLLPMSMLPGFMQKMAAYTPMPSIYYTPSHILSDTQLAFPAVLALLKEQCLWVGVLFLALALMWRIALKHYNPQGG